MRLLFLLTACVAIAAPNVQWSNLPLSFELNAGQSATNVRYLARGNGYSLYLSSGEVVLAGRSGPPLRTKLAGSNPAASIIGEHVQSSTSNYFGGTDASKWRTSIPNYERVRYAGIYPGIDLLYYGNEGTLEYDWIVAPGADPQRIRMVFDGTGGLRIDRQGDLVIRLGKNEYRHRKPVVYQEMAGARVHVTAEWRLHGKEASFRLGGYDHEKPLTIDPPLIYSTYQGGSGLDYAYAVAVDQAGNTYITGGTGSTNFPTVSPLQGARNGQGDVFITKINATGTGKIYSTYLGGGGVDEGRGIAVDGAGNAYITGSAGSFDFPMKNAIQGTWGGSGDAFVTKLDATGSALVYSTYLGGNSIDMGTAIALDPAGNAYITGVTFSPNFPTVAAFQSQKGTVQDAFVAKINAAGSAWVYVTYLGGNNVDEGYAIAVDATGNAYITGQTFSTNFPLQSPIRGSNLNTPDAFVTKLNPAGSALVFSTYLGGSATDSGNAIAIDASGIYVAGSTTSSDFPVVNPLQPKIANGPGVDDAFVTKLSPSGSGVIYSTYLGGGSGEEAYAVAVDSAGNAWVTGRTNSSDFPLKNPLQITRFAFDVFVTEINAAGSDTLFSTFIGGNGSEEGRGIAVDSAGNAHVAGDTTSTDFPIKNAIQSQNGGGGAQDAFVLMIGDHPLLGPPAGLRITLSHTGAFVQGYYGAYAATVSNAFGATSTSGTVTVTDVLPTGELPYFMSGDGWACDTSQITCTRSDALAPGSSYPPLTIYVLIAKDAPVSVANQVRASGGGFADATASDPTSVRPPIHPPFFTGETQSNGTYSLKLANGNLFGSYVYTQAYDGVANITHADLGSLYVSGDATPQGTFIFDFQSGHYWSTGADYFPYVFDYTLNAWLYCYPDSNRAGHYTSNPRYFYNFSTNQVFTM